MIVDTTHNSYQYRIITFWEMRRGPYSCSINCLSFSGTFQYPPPPYPSSHPHPLGYIYMEIYMVIYCETFQVSWKKRETLNNLFIPWLIASWIMDFNHVVPLTNPRTLFNLVSASNVNVSFFWQAELWNRKINSQRFIVLVRLNTHLSQTQDTVLWVKTTSMERCTMVRGKNKALFETWK